MICKEKHICYCGTSTIEKGGHEVGTHGCVRMLTEAPKATGDDFLKWEVNGTKITDFTLRQQRGYSQCSCGCWTRAPTSSNSIEGDW